MRSPDSRYVLTGPLVVDNERPLAFVLLSFVSLNKDPLFSRRAKQEAL